MPKGMFACVAIAAIGLAAPASATGYAAEMKMPNSAQIKTMSTQIKSPAGKLSNQHWYGASASYQHAINKAYGSALGSRIPRTLPGRKTSTAPARPNTNQTGDYLNEMLEGGGERWSPNRLPLMVFIGGGAGNYRGLFATAMNEWSAASERRITWSQTNDPDDADITVSWQPTVASSEPESGETRSRYSRGPNGMRYIVHSDITIVSTSNGGPVSDDEMKKICLHEIGHALGLRHCSNSGDIMYWQSNGGQVSALGPRDARTISQLYSGLN